MVRLIVVRLVMVMRAVLYSVMVVMVVMMDFICTANTVPARSHVDPYRIVIFVREYLEPAGDRMLLGDCSRIRPDKPNGCLPTGLDKDLSLALVS